MESTKCASSMIVPEVLTEDNYEVWKILMKSYLLGEGLWDIVEGSERQPARIPYSEFNAWGMRNGKALHAILISCGAELLFLIKEKDSAKDAWDHLASMFQKQISSDATGTNLSVGEEEMAAADTVAGYLQDVYRAVYLSDWETTKSLLEKPTDSMTAIISTDKGTVLHVAVTIGNLHFVNQLLEVMTTEAIDTVISSFTITPLYMAASYGFTEIAEVLVEKHGRSLEIPGNRGYIPVVVACAGSQEDTTRYLYGVTKKEALIQEENGTQGATLINMAIDAKMYDIAIDLLRNYPQLSITIDLLEWTTIRWLSQTPNAFASGGHYNILQQRIYSIPGIERIHKKKTNHKDALEVLKIVCSQLKSLDEATVRALGVHESLFSAVEFGIVEIVSELAKINPDLLSTKLGGVDIFSKSILLRQEKVFNFLCGKMKLLDVLIYGGDDDDNNLLHYAGMLSPLSQQGKIAGAALQMQSELQWFQEVEKIVPLELQDVCNKEGLKPRELFTKQHAELVEKGEKWMKHTANSCMIVSTLIATVTFTAAFTVPGGNDPESGFPLFLRHNFFLLFTISDALSLFSSSTSVLMFLSIYTSRYAEEDFLKSLPDRMIIGLSTLFFSILTMMVAFCATMFLNLHKDYKWAAILVTFLAAVPVILFIRLQFPLFLDMILSTHGLGLFHWTRGFETWIEMADSGQSERELLNVQVAK